MDLKLPITLTFKLLEYFGDKSNNKQYYVYKHLNNIIHNNAAWD